MPDPSGARLGALVRRGASILDITRLTAANTTASTVIVTTGRYWPMASTSGRGGHRRRAVLGDPAVSLVKHGAQNREDQPRSDREQRGGQPPLADVAPEHGRDHAGG